MANSISQDIVAIQEIPILRDVKLIYQEEFGAIHSINNLKVQFDVQGEAKGNVRCYLLMDGLELTSAEKNYLIPLFVEAMNILVGKQLTEDKNLGSLKIKMSPPKINILTQSLSNLSQLATQTYQLKLENYNLSVLIEYNIEILN